MNEINLITFPDILHNEVYSILFIHPNKELKAQFKNKIMDNFSNDVNVYYFEELDPDKTQIDWLLNVVNLVNIVIFDVDNSEPKIKNLASYLISKNKTYWLTNDNQPVYNHISYKRKYNLDFLLNIGVQIE